jgi:ubiquinone/menaquinone biosynthesis C-methylase UbiE
MTTPESRYDFDRMASVYDAQRAHPSDVSLQIGAAIVEVISAHASNPRLLELGVGTGRIALPTVMAGANLVGLDHSREMLAVAAEHAVDEGLTIDLLHADARQLPCADNAFDAVLAVHVLHLIDDWRATLDEVVRVLQPAGRFIQGSDWRDPESCVGLMRAQLRAAAIDLMPDIRPPGADATIEQYLQDYGGVAQEPIVAASWKSMISPADVLRGMLARNDSETWILPGETLAAAVVRVQDWAEQQWADLEQPQSVEQRFVLNVTRFGVTPASETEE